MAANYTIEDHKELISIGRRTHTDIDSELDALELAATHEVWYTFTHRFIQADLINEINPAVVQVPLPAGQTLTGAHVIFGSIDGRLMPMGSGWQPSADGLYLQMYIPTDAITRARYLIASPFYSITWQG